MIKYEPNELLVTRIIKAMEGTSRIQIDDQLQELFINRASLPADNSQLLKNPFHVSGPIPPNGKSYVPRDCDTVLFRSLTNSSLLAITGSLQIGKTSLWNRIPSMLGNEWLYIQKDLMGIRADTTPMFTKTFFRIISEAIKKNVMNWEEIVEHTRQRPIAILFDELGSLRDRVAQAILPRFRWLAEHARPNIRIVCTMPVKLEDYMQRVGIINPKDIQAWRTIEVGLCTELQIDMLLSLFPVDLALSIREFRHDIHNHSKGLPVRIQSLFHRLFEKSGNNSWSARTIHSLVNDLRNYDPEFYE